MSNLFEAMVTDGDDIKAKIPSKGWRKIVSINGVTADRIKALAKDASPDNWDAELNVLLPQVMAMTDAPFASEVTVVAQDVSGAEDTIVMPYKAVDKKVVTEALVKNFEGIIALGKAAGLTMEEINVVFAVSLMEFEKTSAMGGVDLQEMMGNMMGNMMGGMAGQGANGGQGPDCQAQ